MVKTGAKTESKYRNVGPDQSYSGDPCAGVKFTPEFVSYHLRQKPPGGLLVKALSFLLKSAIIQRLFFTG